MGDEAVAIPEVLIGFPPIIAPDTHTLVLGSFPSKASLATSQYYGHPKNHFWQLMDWMFEPVHRKDAYETRLGALLSCGVGLWDVFYSCERAGSMDVDIRNATFNDFASLSKLAPHLKRWYLMVELLRGDLSLFLNADIAPIFYHPPVLPILFRFSINFVSGKK